MHITMDVNTEHVLIALIFGAIIIAGFVTIFKLSRTGL